MKKSDVIMLGISRWDALTPLWQEKYFTAFAYAMPYKACISWYNTLFSNNPNLHYNKPGEERELGKVILKEDKRGVNRPKFAFIVNRNISDDIINLDSAPTEQKQSYRRLINWTKRKKTESITSEEELNI